MPRASDGSYSLPSGSLVSVGEDIVPSQHNPPLQDIAQALTGSLSRDGSGGMRNNLPMGGFRVTNMAPGIQSSDAATVGQIATSGGVPIGCILDFAGSTVPTGWLLCAGQSLSRTDFSDLFAAIGTTYGAPSGSTFNIPDLRGRTVAGRDMDQGGFVDRLTAPDSRTLGAAGGAQDVTLTEAQMPAHTHTVSGSTNSAGDHTHAIPSAGGGSGGNRVVVEVSAPAGSTNTGTAGAHTHTLAGTADSKGGGTAHPNVQPTIILNKIIKASNG